MTLNQMMIFSAVCSEGTLSKAADKLYISQSAVSKAIKEISRQSGLTLFTLVGRKLQPTDAALRLLEDVQKVLTPYNTLQQKLASNATTHYAPSLHVGCSNSIEEAIIPKVVSQFMEQFPNIKLHTFSSHLAVIERALLLGEFECAIITGNVVNANIIQETFAEEVFLWVCSATHPLANEKDVDFKRLAKEPLYLPGPAVFDLDELEMKAQRQGIKLTPTHTTTNPIPKLNMVMRDSCVALMSYNFVVPYLEKGDLKLISTSQDMGSTRKVGAIYLRDKTLSEPARHFLDLCRSAAEECFRYPVNSGE